MSFLAEDNVIRNSSNRSSFSMEEKVDGVMDMRPSESEKPWAQSDEEAVALTSGKVDEDRLHLQVENYEEPDQLSDTQEQTQNMFDSSGASSASDDDSEEELQLHGTAKKKNKNNKPSATLNARKKQTKAKKKEKKLKEANEKRLADIRKRGEMAMDTQKLLQSLYSNEDAQDEIAEKKKMLLLRLKSRAASRAKTPPRSSSNNHASASSQKESSLRIPVVRATENPLMTGKAKMLRQLKQQGFRQGAEEMAKMFGYSSYQEQRSSIRRLEEKKLAQLSDTTTSSVRNEANDEEEEEHNMIILENKEEKQNQLETKSINVLSGDVPSAVENIPEVDGFQEKGEENMSVAIREVDNTPEDVDKHLFDDPSSDSEISTSGRMINEPKEHSSPIDTKSDSADSEENSQENKDNTEEDDDKADVDKAAVFRAMLEEEEIKSKRKKKNKWADFVENEAEEEEEENALQIGGLGDFGFGVPTNKKMMDSEDRVAGLCEDDLEGIVDRLSDNENDEDAGDFFRVQDDIQDQKHVKEVMRNVREGFGRKQRAFSGRETARGRFGLDELVAADGSKHEAARLGLLESDEELSDDGKSADEEEDEETTLERMIRQRHLARENDVYITSSEDEEENLHHATSIVDGEKMEDVDSDDERERIQMHSFNEIAKRNRRLQRMSGLERQESTGSSTLDRFQDDEESQELFKCLVRTDCRIATVSTNHPPQANSGFGLVSKNTSSSFARVADSIKTFSSSNNSSKAFVFTSMADKVDDKENDSNEVEPSDGKRKMGSSNKATSWKESNQAKNTKKRRSKGGLFAALEEYQCSVDN